MDLPVHPYHMQIVVIVSSETKKSNQQETNIYMDLHFHASFVDSEWLQVHLIESLD
jgi:hypothetical protein